MFPLFSSLLSDSAHALHAEVSDVCQRDSAKCRGAAVPLGGTLPRFTDCGMATSGLHQVRVRSVSALSQLRRRSAALWRKYAGVLRSVSAQNRSYETGSRVQKQNMTSG